MQKFKFTSDDGVDFSATRKAEEFLMRNGYSFGSMQRNDPRGIMNGDYLISKWRHFTQKERSEFDGVMTGSPRNGPVFVDIYDESAVLS
jgi:hypothetical protein